MNKPTIAVGASLLASTLATAAVADTIGFDTDAVGSLPPGWVSGVTGKGSAHVGLHRCDGSCYVR